MGLFCRGLHCAGCGKGIPLALVLFVIGLFITTTGHVLRTLEDAAITVAAITASAWVVGIVILSLAFGRHGKGPRVVCIRTPEPLYSVAKYRETGDAKWLALSGRTPAEIEAPHYVPNYHGQVVIYSDRD
jgi:hypothetical protein